MALLDNYSIELTHDSITTALTPVNETLSFLYERENENEIFYRKKLDTKLKLHGSDFELLKNIDEGPNRCDPITIEIDFRDNLFYSGKILINTVDFDYDKCVATVRIEPDDAYTCIKSILKTKINLLNVTPATVITWYTGTIEEMTCQTIFEDEPTGFNDDCLPNTTEWLAKSNTIVDLGGDWQHTTVWQRENGGSGVEPVGDGWVHDGTDWVRRVKRKYDTVNSYSDATGTYDYWIIIGEDVSLDNGRPFNNCLIEFFDQCSGLTVKSDFFGINPDATNPSNDVYDTHAPFGMRNMYVFQKSDVTLHDATNNATKLDVSLEEFLLEMAFHLNVFFEVTGTTVRVEHISYFENNQNGTDLSSHPAIEGNHRFNRKVENLPEKEVWLWADSSEHISSEFNGDPVLYDCPGTEGEIKEYKSALVTTDIEQMIINPGPFGDSGMVWVACFDNASNEIIVQYGHGSSTTFFYNGHLSRSNLHDQYMKHRRLQATGTMNGSSETFESYMRTKLQVPISFRDPEPHLFDPGQLIQTQMGWGENEKVTFDAKSCKFTVELLHEE